MFLLFFKLLVFLIFMFFWLFRFSSEFFFALCGFSFSSNFSIQKKLVCWLNQTAVAVRIFFLICYLIVISILLFLSQWSRALDIVEAKLLNRSSFGELKIAFRIVKFKMDLEVQIWSSFEAQLLFHFAFTHCMLLWIFHSQYNYKCFHWWFL